VQGGGGNARGGGGGGCGGKVAWRVGLMAVHQGGGAGSYSGARAPSMSQERRGGGGAAQRRSRAGGATGCSSEQPHLYSRAEKKRGGSFTDHSRHAHGRGYLSEAPAWGRGRSSVGVVGTSEGDVVTRCMEGSSKKRAETCANAPLLLRVACSRATPRLKRRRCVRFCFQKERQRQGSTKTNAPKMGII